MDQVHNYKYKDIYKNCISFSLEILYTRIGIVLTIVASVMVSWGILDIILDSLQSGSYWKIVEQGGFVAIVTFLIYGSILYQLTRIGYMKRLKKHNPASLDEVDTIYDTSNVPPVAILIPSCKEEVRIIKQTLLSAALQTYPNRRVVLLIDDPPNPSNSADMECLLRSRSLTQEVQEYLRSEALKFDSAFKAFMIRKEKVPINLYLENLNLLHQYREVVNWFRQQVKDYPILDHTDELFVDITYRSRVKEYEQRIYELDSRLFNTTELFSEEIIVREYRRLVALFNVELASFERKCYENLSHEPNKAMNLNSYMGLLGKDFREVDQNNSLYLRPVKSGQKDLCVPDADYLVTLDADSLLDPDYALRLIHFMKEPGNERVAIVQTPYSAMPNSPGLLERSAGATTDMQYIIHQGFTYYKATFWVGANALIRKKALQDIQIIERERGFKIMKFIQDRTVIEDTESSVDLIDCGWGLHNYPERLSYSATPQDFGSLLIQRRRWGNGGLIILPKLLRYLFRGPMSMRKFKESFMRFHYLVSITGVNLGVLMLLLYPFEDNLRNFWLPLTAIPYFFLYGRDLVHAGYKIRDLFRVYALNLMLIPVNLGGVFKSIQQLIAKQKIPFSRTPKVMGRTAVPPLYILSQYLFLLYCTSRSIADYQSGCWMHAVFVFVTAIFFVYILVNFIGLKESIIDLFCLQKQKLSTFEQCERPVVENLDVRN
jgi:cellulose synthase/poly-beta-1,6-N-acetylglucosamine synthase-like glycosyltransferase